jgi:DNA-binding MarR family transcriptional regulator
MQEKDIVELPIEFESKAHEALMNVWWTANMLRKVSTRFFHEFLSSDAQFNVLVLLKDSKTPLTQNDLSKKLLVDKSNITGLLDRLQKQGLIQRLPVEGDRRSYHIRLTKEGTKLINKLDNLYTEKVRRITSQLTERDCNDLIRVSKKIRAGLFEEENNG